MYYIANVRMPNEKAHGIQIAKMCEAFIASGVDLTLVVSSRGSGSLKAFYGLTEDIPTVRLSVFDLQFLGRVGYWLTALQFSIRALLYLWSKVLRGELFCTYTIDMDNFSFAFYALVPRPLIAEMHSPKKYSWLTRPFFKHAKIIATNALIAKDLAETFCIHSGRMLVEPNGVDEKVFTLSLTQHEARKRLNLPDEPFALYVGRIYGWKGLGILADAAHEAPLPILLVGGTREEYERITNKDVGDVRCIGVRPSTEIPLWLAAADILLVLGTRENEESFRHTSPMKLFEYLAARRPVVASRTPANTSILPEDAVFWYAPDDAQALLAALKEARESSRAATKVEAGYRSAQEHTWRARARRILAFSSHDTLIP